MAVEGEKIPSEVIPTGGADPMPDVVDTDENFGGQVASGAKWSMIGNLVTRAGSMVVGIVVANLLDPSKLGVFAVAMTVGQMLLIFIDMGLATDLVRGSEEEMERKAPTTASLGMIFCTLGAALLLATATPVANALGSPESASLLRVYSIMVFIGGLAIVPQAVLTRRLDQKSLAIATVGNFVLNNTLTLVLLAATGIGVLALPIGAVAGMALEVALFYVLAKRRIHFGWDRSLIKGSLAFGAPVAGANVLQVLLSNVDRLVISPILGPKPMGFYTLASNISNWPVSVFGIVVRSVATPAFARTKPTDRDPVLTLGAQLTWLISAPVGLMLALFAHDTIFFLYGPKYDLSVPLLASLGIYGAIRVMFDTLTGFLYARGNSRAVLVSNIVWTVALFGGTWFAARHYGTEGAAIAQVVVCVFVALPLFLRAAASRGGSVADIGKALVPATLACIPAAVVSVLLVRLVDSLHLLEGVVHGEWGLRLDAALGLAVGGLSFLAVYAPLVYRKIRASMTAMRHDGLDEDDAASQPLTSVDEPQEATTAVMPAVAQPSARRVAPDNLAVAASAGAVAATRRALMVEVDPNAVDEETAMHLRPRPRRGAVD